MAKAGDETTLYEFSLSHFCEKARWALDHHGVRYRAVALAPGMHAPRLRWLGAPGKTVPVVVWRGRVIQGSGALIDALDAGASSRVLTPAGAAGDEARALEASFDDAFGRDLRAVAYDVLLGERDAVIAMWSDGQPPWVRWAYRAFWPQVSLGLRKLYRLRPANVEKAKASMDAALDALDARLADGRRYLVGDALSRADVAACALLSPMIVPAERPWQPPIPMPASFEALRAPYRDRPFWRWVEARYASDRGAALSA